jgi:small basic protein
MVPVLGLIIGILIGVFFIPVNIPQQYSNYVAVAILAALDSVFGGIAATVQGKFDMKVFLSGFFGNALLAACLAYIGDQLGIQIYLAAIFAFGNRIFLNFAIIRRFVLNKSAKKDNIL